MAMVISRPRMHAPQMAPPRIAPRGHYDNRFSIAGWLALLCLLAMFLQEVSLARDHFLNKLYRVQPDTFFRGLVLTLPLLASAAVVLSGMRLAPLPPGWGLLFGLFGLSTFASGVMSLETCLESKNRFADFMRFGPTWAMLFVSYFVFAEVRRRQGMAALLTWFDRFAYLAIFDAMISLGFGAAFYGFHISNWFYIFLVGYAILHPRLPEWWSHIQLLLSLSATVLSGKRTNLVLLSFTLLLALVIRVMRGGQIRRLLITLGGLAIVGISADIVVAKFTGGENLADAATRVFKNLSEVVVEENYDNSYRYRINEVENVKAFFSRHPQHLLFGIGFGGEIPMLYDTGPTAATIHGNMRHVHKGYWLYLLRNGVLGLSLLAVFAYVSTLGLYRATTKMPLLTACCALYAASRLVASFGGNLMMEDLDLPIAVGLGFAMTDRGFGDDAPSVTVHA